MRLKILLQVLTKEAKYSIGLGSAVRGHIPSPPLEAAVALLLRGHPRRPAARARARARSAPGVDPAERVGAVGACGRALQDPVALPRTAVHQPEPGSPQSL